jgi:hypothetical protein
VSPSRPALPVIPRILLAAVVGLAAASGPAFASLFGLPSAELTGSRDVTAGGGLTGFNDYDNGLFRVAWEIDVDSQAGTAHYRYTFTGLGGRDISNIVLSVTPDPACSADPECVRNATIDGVPANVEFGAFSGIVEAVKLEGVNGPEGVTYAFDSNRNPVYGHLAVKDGGGQETCADPAMPGANVVCSDQLLGIGDPSDPVRFVVVPNGVVPEPGTAALLLLGLAATAWARRPRCA